MRIYGDSISGNCLKIKWTADALGLAYDWAEVDIRAGATRTAAFLALNPAGQVPVVEFPDGRTLAQSNAVIRYLARGTYLLPEDPFLQAKCDEWMFWEQYSHEPYIAVARAQVLLQGKAIGEIEERIRVRGEAALDLMERHLGACAWFVGDGPTVADIALVAYTRVASTGGFDLTSRPQVRAWIARVETALGLPQSCGDEAGEAR